MYLGVDLGTSELKLLLLDDKQRVVASVNEPLTVSRPQPLWSEQYPNSWWIAFERGMARLKQESPAELGAVKAIGLSGQMHGAVLLDDHDRILRPAILWNDARSGAQCAELENAVPDSREITGNLAMPGFTAPKLLWLAHHEQDIFRRTAKVLLPKDYLRVRLSGDYVSDLSDAAGTLWLNVRNRDWSDQMLDACGLNRTHMPALVEGCAPSATLRHDLAKNWVMGNNVVIAGGAGDNAASAIGMGIINNGQAFISLGTSGVFFIANDRYRPNPAQGVHTFCHALPSKWHQMAVILSAASCLRWATLVTGAGSEAALLQEIATVEPGELAQAPIFLPYLSGERTPHNDPHAQGVWLGLNHGTTRAALGYAVLEGVAFALLDGYRALQAAGSSVTSVSLVGGGSKSGYWARVLASALQLTLIRHSGSEVGGALGAARLAMSAINPNADVDEICAMPPVLDETLPDADMADAMQSRFARFQKTYAALRPLFNGAP